MEQTRGGSSHGGRGGRRGGGNPGGRGGTNSGCKGSGRGGSNTGGGGGSNPGGKGGGGGGGGTNRGGKGGGRGGCNTGGGSNPGGKGGGGGRSGTNRGGKGGGRGGGNSGAGGGGRGGGDSGCQAMSKQAEMNHLATTEKPKSLLFPDVQLQPSQAKLCLQHQLFDGKCIDPNCLYLHVCKTWLSGRCCPPHCSMGHNFLTEHNIKVLLHRKVPITNNDHLLDCIRDSLLKVCWNYNFSPEGCANHSCSRLHVCAKFALGTCQSPKACGKCHNFSDPHTGALLAKYHIDTTKAMNTIFGSVLVVGVVDEMPKSAPVSNLIRKYHSVQDLQLTSDGHPPLKPGQVKLCATYIKSNGECNNATCGYLHICKMWLERGSCKTESCKLGHTFNSPQNQKVLKARKVPIISNSSDEMVEYIRQCFLTVCRYYNKPIGCSQSTNCRNAHICRWFVLGICRETNCSRNHSYHDENCMRLRSEYCFRADTEDEDMQVNVLVTWKSEDSTSPRHDLKQEMPLSSASAKKTKRRPRVRKKLKPGVSMESLSSSVLGSGSDSDAESVTSELVVEEQSDATLVTSIKQLLLSHGGFCSYSVLVEDPAVLLLFTTLSNFQSWLLNHTHEFVCYLSDRQLEICLKFPIWLCKDYNSPVGCSVDTCKFLHVCRDYIGDREHDQLCSKAHDFQDAKLRKLLRTRGFDRMSKVNLKYVVAHSFPALCTAYNEDSCSEACGKLHVCQGYVDGTCKSNVKCGKWHDLNIKSNMNVLKKFGLAQVDIKVVKHVILPISSSLNTSVKEVAMSASPAPPLEKEEKLPATKEDKMKKKKAEVSKPDVTDSMLANLDNNFASPRDKVSSKGVKTSQLHRNISTDSGFSSFMKRQGTDSDDDNCEVRVYDDDDFRDICVDFLSNKCYAPDCHNHHCELPYYWQYKTTVNQRSIWKLFEGDWCCVLEQKFCDPAILKLNLTFPVKFESQREPLPFFGDCKIAFDSMELTGCDKRSGEVKVFEIRHLSTPPFNPDKDNSPFSTRWRWYYGLPNGEWKGEDEGSPFMKELERKYAEGQAKYKFRSPDGDHYEVNFEEMYFLHEETGTRLPIRSRPLYVSPEEVQELARGESSNVFQPSIVGALKQVSLTSPPSFTSQPSLTSPSLLASSASLTSPSLLTSAEPVSTRVKQVIPASSVSAPFTSRYPDPVFHDGDEGATLSMLQQQEFGQIRDMFHESMPAGMVTIREVQKISNRQLWRDYDRKRRHLSQTCGANTEARLFYGWSCDKHLVNFIVKNNFLSECPQLEGLVNLGSGVYFTKTSHLMHRLMPSKADGPLLMFVGRVALGLVGSGTQASSVHTVLDDFANPAVYMATERQQCYPEYIIQYTVNDITDSPLLTSESMPEPASSIATSAAVSGKVATSRHDILVGDMPPPYSEIDQQLGGSSSRNRVPVVQFLRNSVQIGPAPPTSPMSDVPSMTVKEVIPSQTPSTRVTSHAPISHPLLNDRNEHAISLHTVKNVSPERNPLAPSLSRQNVKSEVLGNEQSQQQRSALPLSVGGRPAITPRKSKLGTPVSSLNNPVSVADTASGLNVGLATRPIYRNPYEPQSSTAAYPVGYPMSYPSAPKKKDECCIQ